MKYKLGDTVYWVESHSHYQKSIPCPMCFGKFFVTIILGDDSKEKIECGYCQRGLERPSGTAITWEPFAIVKSGVISGISTRNGIIYEIDKHSIEEHALHSSRADADIEREKRFEEEKSRAEARFRDNFIQAKKKQVWSAGYHRECINREKRSIEWHELRLGLIADRKKSD